MSESTVDIEAIRGRLAAITQGEWAVSTLNLPRMRYENINIYANGGLDQIGYILGDGTCADADAAFIINAASDLKALLAQVETLTTERDQAQRRLEYVLGAAHAVLEDMFAFPVNTEARVFVLGYDVAQERQRLSVYGDTAQDVLRLKELVDELEASKAK